jgi:hypothetical protein
MRVAKKYGPQQDGAKRFHRRHGDHACLREAPDIRGRTDPVHNRGAACRDNAYRDQAANTHRTSHPSNRQINTVAAACL